MKTAHFLFWQYNHRWQYDTWIVQCTPEKNLLQNSYEKGFRAESFKHLEVAGIREDEVKRAGTSLSFILGMVELLNFIRKDKDKFYCIIISDSKSVSIYGALGATSFHDVFDKVFANPAVFDNKGHLTEKLSNSFLQLGAQRIFAKM